MTGLLILMLIMEGLDEVSSRWAVTESYSVILQPVLLFIAYKYQGCR